MLGQAGSDFGIFAPLFGAGTPYLTLLHLDGPQAERAVRRVQHCVRSVEDPFPNIYRFLEDPNWRPHLVAAIALVEVKYDRRALDELWKAIDCGSWVVPQLAVVASLRDPDFATKAKVRLIDHCKIDLVRLAPLDPIMRHSSAGPGGLKNRAAKAAVVLVHLLKGLPDSPGWLISYVESKEFSELASHDLDNSAQIAEKWMASLKALI